MKILATCQFCLLTLAEVGCLIKLGLTETTTEFKLHKAFILENSLCVCSLEHTQSTTLMQNRLNLTNMKTSTVPCSVVKHAGSA